MRRTRVCYSLRPEAIASVAAAAERKNMPKSMLVDIAIERIYGLVPIEPDPRQLEIEVAAPRSGQP